MFRILFASLALMLSPLAAHAATFDHSRWDRLVHTDVVQVHGGQASQVNYDAFKRDHNDLDSYLKSTEGVTQAEFDGWTKSDQLAFLINVYNARTVQLVLTRYPDLHSIKDLGTVFQMPWQKPFFQLFGRQASLDDVEQGLIRGSGRYDEPRVHFAVNCASIGCPALRNEAYTGARLDAQLDDQARKFLADRQRNALTAKGLELSSIFKWYRGDFEKGWHGAQSLPDFLGLYASELGLSKAQLGDLKAGRTPLVFRDYDWTLNRTW